MKKFTEFIAEDVFKQHQLAIAKKTLNMPDAMVGVMGGPSKEEARKIVQASDKSRREAKSFAKSHKFTLRGLYKEETQTPDPGHHIHFQGGHHEHSFHGYSSAKKARDLFAKHLQSKGHKVKKTSLQNQLLHGMYGNVYVAHYNESVEKGTAMKKFEEFVPEGFKQALGYSKEYLEGKKKHPYLDSTGKKFNYKKFSKYREKNPAKFVAGVKEEVEPITELKFPSFGWGISKKRASSDARKIVGYVKQVHPKQLARIHKDYQENPPKSTGDKLYHRSVQKALKVGKYAVKEEVQLDETMTRKHFQQVADVIKAHPNAEKRAELAKHHATIFKASNPRFDHKRFYAAANATVNESLLGEASWMVIDHEGKRHEVHAKDALAAKKHAVSVGGLHPKGVPMTQWSKVKVSPMPSTGLHGQRGQAHDGAYRAESVEEGVSLKKYNANKKEQDKKNADNKAFTAPLRLSDTKGKLKKKFVPDPKVWKKMPALSKLLGVKLHEETRQEYQEREHNRSLRERDQANRAWKKEKEKEKKDKERALAHLAKNVKEEYDYPDPGPQTNAHKVGDKVIPKIGPHKGQVHTVIHVHPDGSYNIKPEVHVSSNKYHQGAARAQHKDLQ